MYFYKLLLHVAGISIVEILFYFYYIGPLETKIFTNEFETLIKSINNDFQDNKYFSIFKLNYNEYYVQNETAKKIILEKQNESLSNMRDGVNESIDENEEFNQNLLKQCIIYWVCFNFIILLIYLLETTFRKLYIEEDNSSDEKKNITHSNKNIENNSTNDFELIRLNKRRSSSINEEQITYINAVKKRYYTILLWSKCCSIKNNNLNNFCLKLVEYLVLAGCIILFQYFFINDIVLKYRILALEEIKYLLYQQLFPLINSIIFPNNQ